jgi:hypothetical protein
MHPVDSIVPAKPFPKVKPVPIPDIIVREDESLGPQDDNRLPSSAAAYRTSVQCEN